MSRLALAVLCSLCAALVVGCSGGGGGHGDEIVFVSTRDGDYALYGMDADGGNQGRISDEHPDTSSTSAVLYQIDPAWSPDGRSLAFASRREGSLDIYVMAADGTDVRRLTTTKANDTQPTWSPDGERIAFARDDHLFVMSADGSGAKRLTTTLAPEAEPSWSPDGRSIAYARRIPGTSIREIWVLPLEGGEAHRVTVIIALSYTPGWSPDSKTLVFSSNRDSDRFSIFRVGVDGKGLRRVTRRSTEDAFEPSFSPDGSVIAFQRGGAIVTIDANGEETPITDPDDNDSDPVWRPVAGEGG